MEAFVEHPGQTWYDTIAYSHLNIGQDQNYKASALTHIPRCFHRRQKQVRTYNPSNDK